MTINEIILELKAFAEANDGQVTSKDIETKYNYKMDSDEYEKIVNGLEKEGINIVEIEPELSIDDIDDSACEKHEGDIAADLCDSRQKVVQEYEEKEACCRRDSILLLRSLRDDLHVLEP